MIAKHDMGAPVREWLIRIAAVLVTVAGFALVVSLPVEWPLRAGLVFVAAPIALVQAVRRIPSFDPLRRVRARLPNRRQTRRCALTFDDGPSRMTSQVLDVLAAEQVPATFFVLGHHVDRHPDIVRRASAEGHAVGIHGLDHRKLAGADDRAVDRQVRGASEALARAGVPCARIYRTPHGCKSRGVFAVARRQGLQLWAWTRGVWDTDGVAASILVRRATRGARSGMVLLLHDGRGDECDPDVSPMIEALPPIIRTLKARGFSFVRLADV
jgi:peptidoglycan-N-acetylglucosamine deacetylase